MSGKRKFSKREFIKYSLCGAGGLTAFTNPATGFAMNNMLSLDSDLWKWSTEAEFYISTPRGVKCRLCPSECDIGKGEVGDCHVRQNEKGKLYSIVYGNPCALHIDPIEKKPLFHFYPATKAFSIATAGCNLSCLNCQNWQISQKTPRETDNYDFMPEKVVTKAQQNNCRSIAYTYSEPIAFYEYTRDTAKLAHKANLKNVMITSGYIKTEPLKYLAKHIDAANVDLKSYDNDIYARLNAGELQPVLDTLKTLKDEGVWLEITNLIVPEWTDDLDMIQKMCKWLYENGFEDYPLHFSRFTPMYKLTDLPPTPVENIEKARDIALDAGLKYVYIGNVPGHKAESTFCPDCGERIIKRRGFHIVENHVVDGKCEFCEESIAGVWK